MGFDPDMSLKFDGVIMRLSRLSWHTTNDAMMWFKNDIGCNVASLALYNYIYIICSRSMVTAAELIGLGILQIVQILGPCF
jgi:hypothetical protein